jgi:high-affinity iron transporter
MIRNKKIESLMASLPPLLAALLFGLCATFAHATPVDDEKAQTVIHMLDYVGVDYPEFVKDGKVVDEGEYQEQREFAAQSVALLEQLPAPDQAALVARARQLLRRIEAKAPGAEVSALAAAVRGDVIRSYKLTVAPRRAPDLARAATLFQAQCAACHGAQGRGDGPLAKGLDPQPSNFHDTARMNQRSLYGLYNTVTLGVKGTPMRAFGELPEADRWALAFFAAGLRTQPAQAAQGEALWNKGSGKAQFASLKELVLPAPGEVAAKDPALGAVHAWLTLHPEAIAGHAPAPIAFTRAKVGEALEALRGGDRDGARQLAITAYLEGFELVEAALDNVDAPLRQGTEREMMALRAAIADGQPVEAVASNVERIEALLDRAEEKLSGNGLSPATAFFSSLLILLREGLEAILVLAAIGAFVVKTGRRDAMPYLHAGWIAALALGALTWVVATYLFAISGANRELTEGVTALVAAAMLLYVGWWLHGKSYAQAWQTFIRAQVSSALGKRTLWAMAGVSFLAVYRELFEIILFYETLWLQAGPDGRSWVLWGVVAAAVLLVLIGGALLRYSVRLPIGPFFGATSALLALLAVVFVGNGIAALQEAGVVASTLVNFVNLPLLGVHPTLQGLGWQATALVAVLAGVLLNRRSQHANP